MIRSLPWSALAFLSTCFGVLSYGALTYDNLSPDPLQLSFRVPNTASRLELGHEQFTKLRHTTETAAHEPTRLFNAHSCAECHRSGGIGGAGPNEHNVQLIDVRAVGMSRMAVIDQILREQGVQIPATPPIQAPQISVQVQNGSGPAVPMEIGPPAGTVRPPLPGSRQQLEQAAKLKRLDDFFVNAKNGLMVLHRKGSSFDYAVWRLRRLEVAAPNHPELHPQAVVNDEARHVLTLRHNPAGVGCGVRSHFVQTVEERNTPALFGLGLIASIPQAEIEAIRAEQPQDIQGRAPRLASGGIGRFGWKSQTATLAEFNENACSVELGLKTPGFTPAELPPRDPDAAKTSSTKLDMTSDEIAAMTDYIASLPAPTQGFGIADARDAIAGRRLFASIGCATCHVPDVGRASDIYSDLMLHSVGTQGSGFYGSQPSSSPPSSSPLVDPKRFDIVRADEFRTPPLWGVADSAPYLHDGSAQTLEDAICRHSGQAQKSKREFLNRLTQKERGQVIAFLGSLRAP